MTLLRTMLFGVTLGAAGLAFACEEQSIQLEPGADAGAGGAGGKTFGSGGAVDESSPHPFVEKQSAARHVLVDGERLYWSTGVTVARAPMAAAVRSCRKDDCGNTLVTYVERSHTSVDRGMAPFPSIAIDSQSIYWADNGDGPSTGTSVGHNTIFACPHEGCAGPPRIVTDAYELMAIATDGEFLFYASERDRAIFRCPVNGCEQPSVVATNIHASSIALDGEHLFLIGTYQNLLRVRKDGSDKPQQFVFGDARISSVAVANGRLFWADGSSISACPVLGCPESGPDVLSGRSHPTGLQSDSSRLYWLEPNYSSNPVLNTPKVGSVFAVELSEFGRAEEIRQLAQEQDLASLYDDWGANRFGVIEHTLATDDDFVYWVTSGKESANEDFPDAAIFRRRK